MNDEKKYNEALERARKLYEQGTITESLCYVFPELKESEDEKIRKDIIILVKDWWDRVAKDNISTKEQMLAWLEKQGKYAENKEFLTSEKRDFGYFNETTNKVEPKFHKGEWIISDTVNKDYRICKITGIKDGNYTIESIYGYKGYNQFDVFDNVYRLWTIQDANPGDVLADDRAILLFRNLGNKNWKNAISYYAILETNLNNWFSISDDEEYWGKVEDCELKPATKEQRDTLEKAMTDAGYRWNSNEKKLEKIEQKPTEWSEEDEEKFRDVIKLIKQGAPVQSMRDHYTNWLRILKDRVQPQSKPEWNEEDIMRIDNIIAIIEGKGYPDYVRWLESLKDRVSCETNCITTKEWNEEDDYNLQCMIAKVTSDIQKGNVGRNNELIDWLKSLKDRYTWKPSEKQMEVLWKYAEQNNYDGFILTSLHQQLKKLVK